MMVRRVVFRMMPGVLRVVVGAALLGLLTGVASAVIPAPQVVRGFHSGERPAAVEGAYVLRLGRAADGGPLWSVEARDEAGRFYAEVTRRQLLREFAGRLPEVLEVVDFPRLPWRGLHLDVSRHFFTVPEVKVLLDRMAALKLNRLHLHLTDGPGWRFTVRGYPRLTELGAWRRDTQSPVWDWASTRLGTDFPVVYGGYYTREDLRELVAYARQRHIVIVPEVDVPGHSYAALFCYPELLAAPGFEPYGSGLRGEDVLDVSRPEVWRFVCAVMEQLMEIFPEGTPIHVGGDEVPEQVLPRAQQRVWLQRLVDWLRSRGRRVIAWDEAAMNGVRGQTVMLWHADLLGCVGRFGLPVILTPTSHCYFDYRQASGEEEPLAMGSRVISLRDVFGFVVPDDPLVVGLQGNLWTEYIRGLDHLLYMAFPRAAALAERAWGSPPRAFEMFEADLARHPEFSAPRFTRAQQNEVARRVRSQQPEEMGKDVRCPGEVMPEEGTLPEKKTLPAKGPLPEKSTLPAKGPLPGGAP